MSLTDELEAFGEVEVRQRLVNGGFGSRESHTYAAVEGWLRGKVLEREAALNAREESRSEQSLRISHKSLRISYTAIIIAIMAILIPIFVTLCTKK